ncbi:PAS domain S-box protein [Sphingomonas immobilis]|uniref:histidine kinase n=1 Tax=Sphingomonas immobilis TaxID=3063997 RepID=A0ABT8ZTJ1_9SPHN|nr:PAS domain S-box protein [Sphingomonas sp. CA1-15]MDO7840880.1 PAS domain S-box protein [Sphingomonas sp. CA1-15]
MASAPDTPESPATLRFLDGGGEMGARMRAFDWAAHPLGPAEHWPLVLKITVSLCLHSSIPTAIYWGPDFRLLYNDAWIPVGRGHPATLGETGAVARADIWPILGPQLERIMTSGEGVSLERQRLMCERGDRIEEAFYTYSSLPIRDESGMRLGVLNTGNEVTSQVRAEQSVRASEERLQMALDASGNVGTWDWDPVTNHIIADERAARLYGVDPAAARRGAPADFYRANVHPDDIGRVSALQKAVFGKGGEYSVEARILPAEGAERWLLSQGRATHEAGVLTRFSGIVLDVTDARRREEELRHARDEREFLLMLTERQRALSSSDDIMQMTATALGERLAVSAAGFYRVHGDALLHYGACWTDGSVPPLTGEMPVADFGPEIDAMMRTERTLVFTGGADDPGPVPETVHGRATRAAISVPLVRDGRWQAGFYLSNLHPRSWSPGEVALVEEVAELSWDSVARTEAIARLRVMNDSLVDQVADRTAERDRIWEASRDLLGIADLEGRWINVNPAWERVLGWPRHMILGRDSSWLRHSDDHEISAPLLDELNVKESLSGFETRYRTSAGDYRRLAWQGTRINDRVYTIARDVTEERQQQAALLAAEERTRLVLEAMEGVGVWTYDIAADRFRSDPGFAALLGFDAATDAGGVSMMEVAQRIHPDDLPKMRMLRDIQRGLWEDGESEYRIIRPDGGIRWIMVRNRVLQDAAGKAESIMGVGVDLTRQRELEERLRQSQKMEAVGQLTGGLAHDFNNLLTGISGALEIMAMRLKQGRIDDLPRYIGAAQTASGRAAALTHRLLAFSRKQPLDPRPTDVARLIAGMEDLVRGTVGPNIALGFDIAEGAWPVLVDPNQLENALLNLCINARDAMPDGGSLTISAQNRDLDAREAAERDVAPGAYLVLLVIDTGTGMSADVVARAFDPFFTTKPMGQGTGLGLSMIYGFARQSGGQVKIESRLGHGTTMALYLPRHHGDVAADEAGGGGALALPEARGERVLVVDDEAVVRMLVVDVLEELGYEPIEASDGAEAVAALEAEGRIDLLVTDVGLPGGMNGRQVADAARALRPDIPVLFITGFAENAVVGDGPLDPGMQLVAKPFAIDALAVRIRDMVTGR